MGMKAGLAKPAFKNDFMNIFYITTTVHISSDFNEAIGATTHTYSIAKELQKLGHELFIVSERYPGDKEREDIDGLHIIRLNRAVVASSQNIKKTKLRIFFRPARIVPNYILARQIADIIRAKKGDLILERGHCRGVGAMAARLTGKPLVLEAIDHINSPMSVQRAKAIIAYTKIFFSEKYQSKVQLVDAGYDPKYFHPVEAAKKYDVAYLGAFKEWDGLEDLVAVAKKMPDKKFLLIGDGVRREVIEKNKPDNMELIGSVPIEEVKNYLCQAKIGVAPFNTKLSEKGEFKKYDFYFSPLKIFEYMACGLPVVSIDFPLISKIIDNDSGLLIEEGNVYQLKAAISNLLSDPVKLEKISKSNVEKSKNYAWAAVARQIDKILP